MTSTEISRRYYDAHREQIYERNKRSIRDHKAADRGDIDELHPAVAAYIRDKYTAGSSDGCVKSSSDTLCDDDELLVVNIPQIGPGNHPRSNIGEINTEVKG